MMSCLCLVSHFWTDAFWRNLSPESVLLARVYIDHISSQTNAEKRLENASLPVVTAFAFYTQEACNAIFESMETLEDARLASTDVDEFHELEKLDDILSDNIFILREMLVITAKLDFSDEIGRKKMSTVIRALLPFSRRCC